MSQFAALMCWVVSLPFYNPSAPATPAIQITNEERRKNINGGREGKGKPENGYFTLSHSLLFLEEVIIHSPVPLAMSHLPIPQQQLTENLQFLHRGCRENTQQREIQNRQNTKDMGYIHHHFCLPKLRKREGGACDIKGRKKVSHFGNTEEVSKNRTLKITQHKKKKNGGGK